MSTEIIF